MILKPQAIIFDLDGVITDTAHLHFLAWRQVAGEIGIAIDEAFNDSLKGISRGESLQRILQYGGKAGEFTPEVCAQLAERKNRLYVHSLRQLTVNSVLLNASAILQALDLKFYFDFCADAALISRSKPDPEIFLAACAGLGADPQQCIGIEDAQAGIDAINACGMLSVGMGTGLNGASLQLPSTEFLTWPCLSALWQHDK